MILVIWFWLQILLWETMCRIWLKNRMSGTNATLVENSSSEEYFKIGLSNATLSPIKDISRTKESDSNLFYVNSTSTNVTLGKKYDSWQK